MSLSAPSVASINGTSLRVGIAAARFNERHVDALLEQVIGHLYASGVEERNLHVVRVPGSNELPSALQLLAERYPTDVLVGLGVIIRGDTIHYELIADAVTHALQHLSLGLKIPVINGVVVAENAAQAKARCFGRIPRGAEFAQTALEMATLKRKLTQS